MILIFIKKFLSPVAVILATAVSAFSGLSIGIWLPNKIGTNSEESGILAHLEVIFNHLLHFTTPVPYFVFSLIVVIIGSLESFFNRYLYGENDKVQKLLRDETQNHGESQRNYFDSLVEALRYLLAGEGVGFDESCRVTIYRLQNNSTSYLKRIFRHSKHRAYNDEGRFRIPVAEGLVGVAWNNHGKVDFEHNKSGRGADQEMQAFLKSEGGTAPTCDLSMPSRSFIIRAIEDLDSSRKIAIVVYESTKNGVLHVKAIDALLDREGKSLSRLVKHLGALDGKLNPDKGGMLS
jgi:hypothetical protein